MIEVGTLITTKTNIETPETLRKKAFVPYCGNNFGISDGFTAPVKRADLIRVETAYGYTLTGTPDQEVLTPTGWKELEALAQGDMVKLSFSDPLEWDEGNYDGADGYRIGASYGRIEVNFQRWMLRSSHFLRGYLSGLFSARGGVYVLKQGAKTTGGSLRYTSSLNDLKGIQLALACLGINSNIIRGKGSTCVNLSAQSIALFNDRITPDGEVREKIAELERNILINAKQQRDYTTIQNVERDVTGLVSETINMTVLNGYFANAFIAKARKG